MILADQRIRQSTFTVMSFKTHYCPLPHNGKPSIYLLLLVVMSCIRSVYILTLVSTSCQLSCVFLLKPSCIRFRLLSGVYNCMMTFYPCHNSMSRSALPVWLNIHDIFSSQLFYYCQCSWFHNHIYEKYVFMLLNMLWYNSTPFGDRGFQLILCQKNLCCTHKSNM